MKSLVKNEKKTVKIFLEEKMILAVAEEVDAADFKNWFIITVAIKNLLEMIIFDRFFNYKFLC